LIILLILIIFKIYPEKLNPHWCWKTYCLWDTCVCAVERADRRARFWLMHIFMYWNGKEYKSTDFECFDLKFGILLLFYWVRWCLMEVVREEEEDEDWSLFIFTQKMKDLFYSFWSLDYVDIPLNIWCGKKLGHITKVNIKLMSWTYLTIRTNNEGVFNNFRWSKDVWDSKWHFQTKMRLLQNKVTCKNSSQVPSCLKIYISSSSKLFCNVN